MEFIFVHRVYIGDRFISFFSPVVSKVYIKMVGKYI